MFHECYSLCFILYLFSNRNNTLIYKPIIFIAVLDAEVKNLPHEAKPHIPGITDIPTPPPSRSNRTQASAASAIPTNPYEYNVTDEEKEHKMFYVGSIE